jgi:hypothetical protein
VDVISVLEVVVMVIDEKAVGLITHTQTYTICIYFARHICTYGGKARLLLRPRFGPAFATITKAMIIAAVAIWSNDDIYIIYIYIYIYILYTSMRAHIYICV